MYGWKVEKSPALEDIFKKLKKAIKLEIQMQELLLDLVGPIDLILNT